MKLTFTIEDNATTKAIKANIDNAQDLLTASNKQLQAIKSIYDTNPTLFNDGENLNNYNLITKPAKAEINRLTKLISLLVSELVDTKEKTFKISETRVKEEKEIETEKE